MADTLGSKLFPDDNSLFSAFRNMHAWPLDFYNELIKMSNLVFQWEMQDSMEYAQEFIFSKKNKCKSTLPYILIKILSCRQILLVFSYTVNEIFLNMWQIDSLIPTKTLVFLESFEIYCLAFRYLQSTSRSIKQRRNLLTLPLSKNKK